MKLQVILSVSVALAFVTSAGGAPDNATAGVRAVTSTGMPFDHEVKLSAADGQVGDDFGYALAVSGDTAIVGAYHDYPNGAAYIFQRVANGTGAWVEVAKLTLPNGVQLGVNAAIDGDTAVVGNQTSAFVFQRDWGGPNHWGQVTQLDFSGWYNPVAISGDIVIVGFSVGAGAAQLYHRDVGGANNWGELRRLTADEAIPLEGLGSSVAISGDTAIVGAEGVHLGSGAAYIFQRDAGGAGQWGQVKRMTVSSGERNFGHCVAVDGSTAIVGNLNGSAFIYQRHEGGYHNWGLVQELSGSWQHSFGASVAIRGDYAIVGTRRIEDPTAGFAKIFSRHEDGADNWGEVKHLIASDTTSNSEYGVSVAISDDRALVGAPMAEDQGSAAGAVYVYSESCDDENPCTIDARLMDGCAFAPLPDGTVCDDGDPRTHHDECMSGVCVGELLDADNDGLLAAEDPCEQDPRNLCFGTVAIDGLSGRDIRINAFGNDPLLPEAGEKTDCNGDVWTADYGFTASPLGSGVCNLPGGCPISDTEDIFGCADSATEDLFQLEHGDNAPVVYSFNVPDRDYVVNLFFANTRLGTSNPGAHVFDILIEGQLIYDDFDQVTAAGASGRAVVRSAVVTVNDGNGLQIELRDEIHNPVVKALEVLSVAECNVDADCDDGNTCTTDTCDVGLCTNAVVADGTTCDDGDPCNVGETCQAGACAGGMAPDCLDPCNEAGCDPAGQEGNCAILVPLANGTSCDDGDACSTGDTCQDGKCSGTLIHCDDGQDCTQDTCVNGNCVHDPAGCSCVSNADCDDGNPCTLDKCVPGSGCMHVENTNPCDDQDPCTIDDMCRDGVCSGSLIQCTAGLTCIEGLCLGCQADADCDDGDACTVDRCADEGCEHVVLECPAGQGCRAGECTTMWDLRVETVPASAGQAAPTSYPDGTVVEIPVPDPPGAGLSFVRWEGDVHVGLRNAEPLVLTMDAHKTVRAVFQVSQESCTQDADCDDGLFCNGQETCADGQCLEGIPPCDEGQMCDEDIDSCVDSCGGCGSGAVPMAMIALLGLSFMRRGRMRIAEL